MSFQDPDQREAMQKRSEENRLACQRSGHSWNVAGNMCKRCGVPEPSSQLPRVVLVANPYRAVWDPAKSVVTIELNSKDAVGSDRWDQVDTISGAGSRSEKSQLPIYELLSKGVKP